MSDKVKTPLVCFAGCDWWYHNRGLFCPQIMNRLAKDHKVLFVNSLGMRLPSFKKDRNALNKIIRKLRSIMKFLRKDDNGMFVLTPVSVPLGSAFGRKANNLFLTLQIKLVTKMLGIKNPVAYVGCPPAIEVLEKLDHSFLIYERTDIFTEMPGIDKDYIKGLDEKLVKDSDLVLYVNRAMLNDGLKDNPNSILIGHGVDYDHFANAYKNSDIPSDIADIAKPIVGFFGEISAKTSDLKLLDFAAKKLPDVSFVMVGPISADVSFLREHDNVHFLGQKSYEQIAHYGKVFDVAIMPWNQNKWIEYCNPVKTKEYLALGNPIVTMYYPEIEPYSDYVYVARTNEEFVDGIKNALSEDSEEMRKKRKLSVIEEGWDRKANAIVSMIDDRTSS